LRPSGLHLPATLWRIDRPAGAQNVCARLYVVRPHQVFGAETAFAETARFIKVSDPVITPAYHLMPPPSGSLRGALARLRFALDSPLEGAVSSEPVSESQIPR
jgi:hypothetical protein